MLALSLLELVLTLALDELKLVLLLELALALSLDELTLFELELKLWLLDEKLLLDELVLAELE